MVARAEMRSERLPLEVSFKSILANSIRSIRRGGFTCLVSPAYSEFSRTENRNGQQENGQQGILDQLIFESAGRLLEQELKGTSGST